MSDRLAVVQGEEWCEGMPADLPREQWGRGLRIPGGLVPWSVHLEAWKGYNAAGHGDQSAERINQRGGFSYREMQCAIAGHYNKCGRCKEAHPPVPGWEPRA